MMATRVFDDVDAYMFISSGAVYSPDTIAKREDETPLAPCTNEQAVDGTPETYGPRKAEGDCTVSHLGRLLETTAEAVGADPDFVTVNDREIAAYGLSGSNLPFCDPDPYILSKAKLSDIGWNPIPVENAIQRTVAASGANPTGPDRDVEKQILETT